MQIPLTLKDRIQAILDHYSIPPLRFDSEIGSMSPRIRNVLKGGQPAVDWLELIVKRFPEISPEWLLTGSGVMIRPKPAEGPDKVVSVTVDRKGDTAPVFVPMEAQAGYAEHIQAHDYAYLQKLPTVSFSNEFFNPKGKEVRIFEVRGDSMEPTFYQGDILFCTDIMGPESIKPGRVYILVTKHNGILVKRAVFHRITGEIELHSDNKFYEPFMIPAEEILEYWYFRRVFSAQAPPPDYTEDRLYRLEKEMFELKQAIIRNAKNNQREIRLD